MRDQLKPGATSGKGIDYSFVLRQADIPPFLIGLFYNTHIVVAYQVFEHCATLYIYLTMRRVIERNFYRKGIK